MNREPQTNKGDAMTNGQKVKRIAKKLIKDEPILAEWFAEMILRTVCNRPNGHVLIDGRPASNWYK